MAFAAVRACADGRAVQFPWSNDPSCPGEYEDIFEPVPGFERAVAPVPGSIYVETGWEPFGVYDQFNRVLALNLPQAEFSRRLVLELRRLPFRPALVQAAADWRQAQGGQPLVGVHIRRTDRIDLHRKQFNDFLTGKAGINRELPVYLTAMYGLCPPGFIRSYENAMLSLALRRYKSAFPDFSYAVFTDDRDEAGGFHKAADNYGAGGARRLKQSPQTEYMAKTDRLRRTTIADAVVDLLCLSQCDAIAQGNRASTFSLVASILGSRPVITAKTMYPFWRQIENDTEMTPNDANWAG